MNYYTVSADTWIPAAGDGVGTISCSGNIVTGSGTFFTIQVEGGDWITNNGEARQVRTVNSDTDLELYKPFSSDFSGQALSIIKEDNAKTLYLGIKNKSGADITVDGESVPNGASVVKGQENAPGYRRKFVEPVYVETTGTVLVNKQSITNRRVNATVPVAPGLFDADYQAVLDYATVQGYSLPSSGQQTLQNQLVVDLKDAGVWSKLDAFSVFATDGDADFALIDWVRLTTQTAVSSPTFTTNQGYAGDGVSAYISTGYNQILNGVNFSNPNGSYGCYVKVLSSTNATSYIGADAANSLRQGGFKAIANVNVGLTGTTPNVLYHLNINSSGAIFYENATAVNSSASTYGADSGLFSFFDDDSTTSFSDGQISIGFIGGDLSAEASDFNTAIQTYISAL